VARPPRPTADADSRFFWEGAEKGELRIQRCSACGTLRHPPRPMCANCHSLAWESAIASGRGEIYSFVVHHHPPVYGFETPFAIALVELEEGTRIVGNVTGVAAADVRVGLPVEVNFVRVDDAWTLPQWRPRE
jgi:uncharacterized OB-fold protein